MLLANPQFSERLNIVTDLNPVMEFKKNHEQPLLQA